MYTAYYDRSGEPEPTHKRVVVARWLARTAVWQDFERAWTAVLSAYDLPYFHMREFAHSTGPFRKWRPTGSESIRRSFVNDLAAIIDEHAEWGVAVELTCYVFFIVNESFELREAYANEYVTAARECVELVTDYVSTWRPTSEAKRITEHVFEHGDSGRGRLAAVMLADGFSQLKFHAPRDNPQTGTCGAVPLQASDFLAYEYFRAMQAFGTKINAPMRGSGLSLFQEGRVRIECISPIVLEWRCRERAISTRRGVQ